MQLRYLLVYLRDRGRVTNTSATMCQLLSYISSWQLATHKKERQLPLTPKLFATRYLLLPLETDGGRCN